MMATYIYMTIGHPKWPEAKGSSFTWGMEKPGLVGFSYYVSTYSIYSKPSQNIPNLQKLMYYE